MQVVKQSMTEFYWPTGYVSHHLDSVLPSQINLHWQDGAQNNLWEKNDGRDIFCTERPLWKRRIYRILHLYVRSFSLFSHMYIDVHKRAHDHNQILSVHW